MDKIPMTRSGCAALERELGELKSKERPAIIRQIAEAREHGDLSENAEYHAAREKHTNQPSVNLRIATRVLSRRSV